MKLLIEEYAYKVKDVENVLDGLFTLQDVKGNISVNYVGYYYNPKIQDVVFILPKVLIDEKGRVFGHGDGASGYDPSALINLDEAKLKPDQEKFIYEFAVWIHRAIVVFNDSHDNNEIVLREQMESEGHGAKKKSNTWLDVILSLIRFAKENQSFFTFVLKNIHSGHNKINWNRTIATTSAVVQCEQPVYINPVNKKRQINFDEELIVIFFSILAYVSDRFGFKTALPFGFKLIKGAQFERYINGYGTRRLHQIKYKYFSDAAVRLWELCYAFFDKAYQIKTSTTQREYLLVKSFHVVFEAMIDELIGDNDVPNGLKEQADGKLVDHFYTYEGLLTNREANNDMYYIGDSKYYKIGSNPGKESVYKQYTYARNVIQWNLNLFLNPSVMGEEKDRYQSIQLRDDVTEGYNVIPNFFISAKIDPDTLSFDDKTERHPGGPNVCRQFENRLYDRDTLIVSHYDVNFLFVLSLYARANAGSKASWKSAIRRKFREEIQTMLRDRFEFYAMTAHPDVDGEEWLKNNFQTTLGKTFRPFLDNGIFSVALDKDPKFEADNKNLLDLLSRNFYVAPCPLGEDPSVPIEARRQEVGYVESPAGDNGKFITTLVLRETVGEDGRDKTSKIYQLFRNHAAEGQTYVMYRLPHSGDISEVKYLIPIFDNAIEGYYEVSSIKFGVRTKIFEQQGVEVPVQMPVLRMELGQYHALETPCYQGIQPRFANQIWSRAQLQAHIDRNKTSEYGASTVCEPAAEYGTALLEDSGCIENFD